MLKINENTVWDDGYTDAMYFNNDDDFFNFCVEPVIVAREYTTNAGDTSYYTDFNFTTGYDDAISRNIAFVIRDPRSNIMKHDGVVSYKTISKKVQNLEPCYMEKVFQKRFAKE